MSDELLSRMFDWSSKKERLVDWGAGLGKRLVARGVRSETVLNGSKWKSEFETKSCEFRNEESE